MLQNQQSCRPSAPRNLLPGWDRTSTRSRPVVCAPAMLLGRALGRLKGSVALSTPRCYPRTKRGCVHPKWRIPRSTCPVGRTQLNAVHTGFRHRDANARGCCAQSVLVVVAPSCEMRDSRNPMNVRVRHPGTVWCFRRHAFRSRQRFGLRSGLSFSVRDRPALIQVTRAGVVSAGI